MRLIQNDCPNTFSKEHDFHRIEDKFICVYCGQKRTILEDGEIIILRDSKKIDGETNKTQK